MNTAVTSKEEILKTSRELIGRQGWSGVNIRSVAAACGVSVGSIYNYFDSKGALVEATVESVWREIFHRPKQDAPFENIQECILWMYGQMEQGSRKYPGFFALHSLGFLGEEKLQGRRRMQQTWQHILEGLRLVLQRDRAIRPDAFTPSFTLEQCADVLFSFMLSALLRQDYDPAPVLEIIRRTLY